MGRGLVGGCWLQNAASDNSLSVGNIIPSRWEQVSQALGTRFPTGWEFLSVQPADGFFLHLQIIKVSHLLFRPARNRLERWLYEAKVC